MTTKYEHSMQKETAEMATDVMNRIAGLFGASLQGAEDIYRWVTEFGDYRYQEGLRDGQQKQQQP